MYKLQCLVALVCVLAAAAGDANDCAGNNPTLPRAAERFKTRLAAATAGCHRPAAKNAPLAMGY